MNTRIALLASALLATNANATDWQRIDQEDDSYQLLVDFDSIQVNGALRSAWYVLVFRELQVLSEDALYRSSALFEHFNCEERTSAIGKAVARDDDHKVVVQTINADWREHMEPVEPDTFAGQSLAYICNWSAP